MKNRYQKILGINFDLQQVDVMNKADFQKIFDEQAKKKGLENSGEWHDALKKEITARKAAEKAAEKGDG